MTMNQRHNECALWSLCKLTGQDYETASDTFEHDNAVSWGDVPNDHVGNSMWSNFARRYLGIQLPITLSFPVLPGAGTIYRDGLLTVTINEPGVDKLFRHAMVVDKDGYILAPEGGIFASVSHYQRHMKEKYGSTVTVDGFERIKPIKGE